MVTEERVFPVDERGRAVAGDEGCFACEAPATCTLEHEVSQLDARRTAAGLVLLGAMGVGFTASRTVVVTLRCCEAHGRAASAALLRDQSIVAFAGLLGLGGVLVGGGIGLWNAVENPSAPWQPWLFGGVAFGLVSVSMLRLLKGHFLRRAGLLFAIEERPRKRRRIRHHH